jgi:transcriptional regulator with XRE-family HTH domain
MPYTDDAAKAWQLELAKRVGDAVKARRTALKMTAQQLAERSKELGYPVTRVAISKIESNSRAGKVDVAELMALAAALDVPPVALLFPDLPEGDVEILPGESGPSVAALFWFTGEYDDPDEPAPGGLGRLLKLTRERYSKMFEIKRARALLEKLAQEQQWSVLGKDAAAALLGRDTEFGLMVELFSAIEVIDRQISEIPGAVLPETAADVRTIGELSRLVKLAESRRSGGAK